MGKTYKMIKTVMLLSAISCCWQGSTSAMEDIFMAIEEIEGGGGPKRSANQAGFFHWEESDCYLKNFPTETTSYLLTFLDPDKDENTLLSLSSCTKSDFWGMQKLIEEKYAETNKKERVYQWQDNPPLTERNLYAFNKRMRTILGVYNSLSGYNNMAGDIDRKWFEKLCSQFKKRPFFPETAVPVMYVEMLGLDRDCQLPGPLVAPLVIYLEPRRNKKRQELAHKFREVVKQEDSKDQNEGALYFHFCQFVLTIPPQQLTGAQNTPLFGKLDGSLMRVMDQELLNLKLTPGLSDAGNFAEIWKKIIDLEPMTTSFQLSTAASSYFNAGWTATDPVVKFENFTKSIKYYEEQLKAIRNAAQSPTAIHYGNIANVCFQAGWNATDPVVKFKNFTNAKGYFEISLKEGVYKGHVQRIREILTQISTYFSNLEKTAHHDISEDMQRDG